MSSPSIVLSKHSITSNPLNSSLLYKGMILISCHIFGRSSFAFHFFNSGLKFCNKEFMTISQSTLSLVFANCIVFLYLWLKREGYLTVSVLIILTLSLDVGCPFVVSTSSSRWLFIVVPGFCDSVQEDELYKASHSAILFHSC